MIIQFNFVNLRAFFQSIYKRYEYIKNENAPYATAPLWGVADLFCSGET